MNYLLILLWGTLFIYSASSQTTTSEDDDDDYDKYCKLGNSLPNTVAFGFLIYSGTVLTICSLYGFYEAYCNRGKKELLKQKEKEKQKENENDQDLFVITEIADKLKKERKVIKKMKWYKVVFSFGFIKEWMKQFWLKRRCFLPVSTHLADQATDIGMIVTFWLIYKRESSGFYDCQGINGLYLFLASLAAFFTYRIVSCIAIFRATKSYLKMVLQFFDLMIFQALLINFKRNSQYPSSPQRWIQNYEAMIESFPQICIQLFYLTKTGTESNTLVIFSLIFSFGSMVGKTITEDKYVFDEELQRFNLTTKDTPYTCCELLCTDCSYVFARVIFRVSDVLFRILLIFLPWILIGGFAAGIYLFIDTAVVLACAVWAKDSTIVTWVGNTPLIVLQKIHTTKWLFKESCLFGKYGMSRFYVAFYFYRWISSFTMLLFIAFFAFISKIDCTNTLLCSTTVDERSYFMSDDSIIRDCYIFCWTMMIIIPLYIISFYKHEILKVEKPTSLSRDLLEMCIKQEWEGITEMFLFGYNIDKTNVNETDKDGVSPLWHTLNNRQWELAEILIKHKADVNQSNASGSSGMDISPLWYLLVKKKWDLCKLVIENGANCDVRGKHGMTPLMFCCQNGYIELSQQLIEHGASLDIRDDNGLTALMWSIRYHHLKTSKMLISKGADIKNKDVNGKTGLILAVVYKNSKVLKLLLENKDVDVNEHDNDGRTAFWYSLNEDKMDSCKLLIENGANIDEKDHSGLSPLWYTLKNKLWNAFRLLTNTDDDMESTWEAFRLAISSQVDADEMNEQGLTPLMYLLDSGELTLCRLLIEKNRVDINICYGNSEYLTPLWYTLEKIEKYWQIFELIVAHRKLNINCKNNYGQTALHYTLENDLYEQTTLLIENGINVNQADGSGYTPLMYICDRGHWHAQERLTLAILLIKYKADVNVKDAIHRESALMLCCKNGYSELVKLIIKHNGNIYDMDKSRKTSFLYSLERKRWNIAQLLIMHHQHSGDAPSNTTETKNDEIYMPSNYPCGWKLIDLWELKKKRNQLYNFLLHRENINIDDIYQDNNSNKLKLSRIVKSTSSYARAHNKSNEDDRSYGMTPLMYSCLKGYLQVARDLIDKHGKVNMQSLSSKMTPLMYACNSNDQNVELATFLIDNNAGVNEKDVNGSTALMYACRKGHLSLARLLINNKCKIDEKDEHGMTALMYSSREGKLSIATLLVENKANVNEKNEKRSNRTALLYSLRNKHWVLSQHLIDDGNATIHDGDECGLILFQLCHEKQTPLFEFVTKCKNLSVNDRDYKSNGMTALMFAAQNGYSELVQILIKYGADIKMKSLDGFTAYQFAKNKGHDTLLQWLDD